MHQPRAALDDGQQLCGLHAAKTAVSAVWLRPEESKAPGSKFDKDAEICALPNITWFAKRWVCLGLLHPWFCAPKVVDEEKCQHKALNCILHKTPLRAAADADICHQQWNTVKNSLNAIGLDMAALKLTILCPPAT